MMLMYIKKTYLDKCHEHAQGEISISLITLGAHH